MFDEQRVRGMKHFANKLWNIARFILIKKESNNFKNAKISSDFKELRGLASSSEDKKWIDKIEKLSKEITMHIDGYKFNLAAERLYEFTWHEFADKYIEDVKNRIDTNSYQMLISLFIIQLKLLHPIMPFITEEIYKNLSQNSGSIMIESWPNQD